MEDRGAKAAAGVAGEVLWGKYYPGALAAVEVDFSASATLVHFDRPLPLLRAPLPAGAPDDPSAGSFVLPFRYAGCWSAVYR